MHAGVTSVMFHARLPERVSNDHQSFLPRNDGTFLVVNLLLPSKELLLQLSDACQ
jgi:hypothetical protein